MVEPACLLEYCRAFPESCRLWVGSRETIDTTSLKRFCVDREQDLAAYRCARVALQFEDNLLLAKALLLLDGVCAQLLLLPPEVANDVAKDFLDDSDTQILLTDCDRQTSATASRPTALWSGERLPPGPRAGAETKGKTRWLVATSGTTGKPKLVVHSLETLTRTVVSKLDKQASYRWALLYGLARFAGLQVFLQAFISASTLVFLDRQDSFERQLDFLSTIRCNALSATPGMWRKILMSGRLDATDLRQVTLGGEIADQKLLTALSRRFPDARVVHIYASTEAGVGFSVKDGLAGFPAAWMENPPSGIALRVDNDGMLFLRAERKQQQYLYDTADSLFDADEFIRSGDLLRRDGDRFHFIGRESGAINVGGDKVHPEEVEAVMLELPAVKTCRVYGKANPFTGQIVIALVSPASDQTDRNQLSELIASHCRNRLQAFKVPALIQIVDDVDCTSAGKVARA